MNFIEKPIKKVYTMKSYIENLKEKDIRLDLYVQRMPDQWNKSMVNEIVYTILTDDYIPAIILGEDLEYQKWIIDGLQRSTSFIQFRKMNYRISSSIKNPIVQFRKKVINEDETVTWKIEDCNLVGKTYDTLPNELQKKFDEFQVETVLHEHCTQERLSELVFRYNNHKSMSSPQKAFTRIDKYARIIREILGKEFFIERSVLTDTEKKNGTAERVIIESVMCTYFLDKWKKGTEAISDFLNSNASINEFNDFAGNIDRLNAIITPDLKHLFNSKDTFIYFTLFDRFKKYKVDDIRFADFLREFDTCMRENIVSGITYKGMEDICFKKLDKEPGTKDKVLILAKLDLLEKLMSNFLCININNEMEKEELILDFMRENISEDVVKEDIAFDKEIVQDYMIAVPENANIRHQDNELSLLAITRYCNLNEVEEEIIETWFADYAARNNTYITDQKENYIRMKDDLEKYQLGSTERRTA